MSIYGSEQGTEIYNQWRITRSVCFKSKDYRGISKYGAELCTALDPRPSRSHYITAEACLKHLRDGCYAQVDTMCKQ